MLSPRMVALGAWLHLASAEPRLRSGGLTLRDPSVEAALAKKHVAPAPQGGDIFASGPKGSSSGRHPVAADWVSTSRPRPRSQPSDADFAELARLGFQAVVNCATKTTPSVRP
ncbi:MAG: hypothetical protein U0235_02170 [Polyangiaceae bacterium]